MLTKHFARVGLMQFLSSCLNTPQMQYLCLFFGPSAALFVVVLCFCHSGVCISCSETLQSYVPALCVCNTFTLCFSLLLVLLEETCRVQSATFPVTYAATAHPPGNRDEQASRASLKGDDRGISFKTSR